MLYVSGSSDDDAVESRARLEDGVPCLRKPFTPRELVRRSRELPEDAPLRS